MARNIINGSGLVQWDGRPLIYEPPLYPSLLALIGYSLGIDSLSFVNIVNAFLFGLVIYLAGLLFARHLTSSVSLSVIGTISVLFSIPLIYVYLWAWTEPLFICFTLFYFFYIDRYLARKDIGPLLLSSLFVALACLTRIVGIILILTGGFCVLLSYQKNFKTKIQHLIYFTIISTLPITIWIIRNLLISGTFNGPIKASSYTYSQELTATFYTLFSWYLPPSFFVRSILIVFGITIISFIGLGFRIAWIKEKANLLRMSPIISFLIVYMVSLVGFSKTAFSGLVDNRYLSPIFIPAGLLLFFTIEIVFKLLFARFSPKLAVISSAVFIVLWLIYPATTTVKTILNVKDQGQGYTSKLWRESETIQYLNNNQSRLLDCAIYSNGNDVVYILSKFRGKLSPARSFNFGTKAISNISSLKGNWPQEKEACLVWLNLITWRSYLYSVDELNTIANLNLIVKLRDGAVYYVTQK